MKLLWLAHHRKLLLRLLGKRGEAGLHKLDNELPQGFYLRLGTPFGIPLRKGFGDFLFDKATFVEQAIKDIQILLYFAFLYYR